MCIHERTYHPNFIALEEKLKERGLIPVTLVQNGRNFSMFVNGEHPVCVERAIHDLKTWHPGALVSAQTANRVHAVVTGNPRWDDMEWEMDKIHIEGRNVPDSLDLEETDADAVYARCLENGYVNP